MKNRVRGDGLDPTTLARGRFKTPSEGPLFDSEDAHVMKGWFPKDGATFLYGVGAVKTFDLLGLFGERLRTSFMGRIQAFFSYIYQKRTEGAGS